MLNYPRDDILVTTARAALFFTLFFGYPVLLHPTRAAINRLVGFIYSIVIERLTRTQWNGNGNSDKLDEKEPLIKDVDYGDDPDSNAHRTQNQHPAKVHSVDHDCLMPGAFIMRFVSSYMPVGSDPALVFGDVGPVRSHLSSG